MLQFSRLCLLLALIVGTRPFLVHRIIRVSSQLAAGVSGNDENILQEILVNQLKICVIHTKIESASIYIDPTVFDGRVYKEENLQLLCSYPTLENQNSFIDFEDYKEDNDDGEEEHDSDNEFTRSNYEQQFSFPIEYQSFKLGVLKLIHSDTVADTAFIETLIKSIALVIFNEYKYNKGKISDSKTKSVISDAYNALFTSRTLAKMLKKRLIKNDLIGTEMVDNIMSQSEYMASLITNIEGNDFRNSDFDVNSNRKYIDVDDDDDDVIDNNVIVEADISTQQIGKEASDRNKNVFFKQSSSIVTNGTHPAVGRDVPSNSISPQPNPNILLIKKTPIGDSTLDTNSVTEKSRIVPAEFWSPDKIEKVVNYDETNDTM